MYAVVKTGGKQYKVAKGDKIAIEKIEGDAGSKVTLDSVLLMNDGKKSTIGAPALEGVSVSAKILEQTRAEKVTIFKKKRRQNYRRKLGHKQHKTVIEITDIKAA